MDRSSYVQKYLWYNHSESTFNAWQLTLGDDEAIAFLAFVAAMLAYAQTRMWTLIRAAVLKLTRPIQLPDGEDPNSLTRLSQRAAVFDCAARLFACASRRTPASDSMVTVSPWYGAGALVNVLCFLMLGTLIPWALTSGLETPVVQTRPQRDCGERYRQGWPYWRVPGNTDERVYDVANLYTRCWLNRTQLSGPIRFQTPGSCTRERGVLTDRPAIHVSRDAPCPFPPELCAPNVQPLQVEFLNLTFRDLGINVKSASSFSRRLTCAPLNWQRFLHHGTKEEGGDWLDFGDPEYYKSNLFNPKEDNRLGVRLSYRDGRSPAAAGVKEASKYLRDQDRGLGNPHRELHSIAYQWDPTGTLRVRDLQLHPNLTRLDGEVLVVSLNVGYSYYGLPIDDPIYSAHQLYPQSAQMPAVGFYFADYEWSSMACLDQHRICAAGISGDVSCTPYTSANILDAWDVNLYPPAGDMPPEMRLAANLGINEALYSKVVRVFGSIAPYLRLRGPYAMLPFAEILLESQYAGRYEQWTRDAEAWLENSLLLVRHSMLGLAAPVWGLDTTSCESRNLLFPFGVLFRDGNFTNINFCGFLLTLALVAAISGISHAGRIRSMLQSALGTLAHLLHTTSFSAHRDDTILHSPALFNAFRAAFVALGPAIRGGELLLELRPGQTLGSLGPAAAASRPGTESREGTGSLV